MGAEDTTRAVPRGGSGEDAEKLLQGIITNDMALLQEQPAIHAGLLTPQGKILFSFFVVKAPGGFCLEAARSKTAELSDRLNLYKLRVKAEILTIGDEADDFVAVGHIRSPAQRSGTRLPAA